MPPESPATPPPQRLRRLPGRSPSFRLSRATASARLWMDDGQLVQETVQSYTQQIQRFAFADIQALQIRRTVRGVVYNGVLGTLLALDLLFAWAADSRAETRLIVGGCIAAPFLILLLVNIARGATCRTVLTTALGPQPLTSLSRMRPARRALEAIIVSTQAVQGALQPEEAALQVDRAQTGQR